MGFLGEHYGSRFSDRDINIDNMIDTLLDVQKQNGIENTMREALFHTRTSERLNVFRRKRMEANGQISEYLPLSNSKPESKEVSNIERGVFVYDRHDLEEVTDEPYVCEFCTLIGAEGEYRSHICDLCDECEKCTDYRNNECDGCEYSILYNGGSTYGEVHDIQDTKALSAEDEALLCEITKEDEDVKTSKDTKEKFTIMNF